MLLVPNGSTDQQVLEWAEQTLSAEGVAELREVIKQEATEVAAASGVRHHEP